MNYTNIEWCDMTWNPVTGCYHDCDYCYARKITHRFGGHSIAENCGIAPSCEIDDCKNCNEYKQIRRVHDINNPSYIFNPKRMDPYPYGFEPTFHKYRLNEPGKRNKPTKIFVSSMGDLFGEWVPDEWIEEVLAVARKCPQHTFIFLTKNPKRYQEFEFFNNCWIGTSIAATANITRAWELLKLPLRFNTFFSIEPLLGPIDLNEYELLHKNWRDKYTIGKYVDWLIVGALTGPGAIKPEKEWVQGIINQCKSAEVPVFLKDNLNWPEKIQEWPENV